MQKIIWSACVLSAVLVGNSTAGSQASITQKQLQIPAGAILEEQQNLRRDSNARPSIIGPQGVMDDLTVTVHPVEAKLDVRPFLSVIAGVTGFADWREGQVKAVRNLHDREARTNAVLWQVQGGVQGQHLGYLVTSPDGQTLYEFSRRPVPELPTPLQAQTVENGYLYGGPALQLAYVNGEQGAELINLLTGEMLPSGELLNRVPDALPAMQKTEASARVLPLPVSTHAQDDALYATGLYGQTKLGKPDTGVQPLQEFARQETYPQPAMVVYDAIPDKFFVTLTLSQAIHLGTDTTFLAVHDPFSMTPEQQQPIYIDSRFPVTAVPVNK